MKITRLVLLSALVAAAGGARAEEAIHQSPATDQPMSETVQGEVKEKLQIQKTTPSIELDVKEIIDSGTPRTDEVLEEAKPVPSDADFDYYAKLDSQQVMHPSLPLLPEPPLVTFYPGLSDVAAKRWEFKVSDEKGNVVVTITGKGAPPRKFDWSGQDEKGAYVTVGTLYSYQFVTYDDHGNAHTFPGDPFRLDALMYTQKGRICIEFANNALFEADEAKIQPGMRGLWERAIDVIREHSNKPLLVEEYSDTVKSPLAEQRRQAAVNSISDATNLPAVDIRHSVEKIADRGDITRLVLNAR